jgi:hypothetical protein
VVAKFRDRLAVNKRTTQKFDGEKFNLRKLNKLERFQTGLQLWQT